MFRSHTRTIIAVVRSKSIIQQQHPAYNRIQLLINLVKRLFWAVIQFFFLPPAAPLAFFCIKRCEQNVRQKYEKKENEMRTNEDLCLELEQSSMARTREQCISFVEKYILWVWNICARTSRTYMNGSSATEKWKQKKKPLAIESRLHFHSFA